MTKSQIPWSMPVRLDDIPETGRRVELEADAATRAALAQAARVNGVARLHAAFDLARNGRGGLHVTGVVSATVRQTCVVTLDPVENEVEEAIDLVFAPAPAGGAASPDAPISPDAPGVEPPEVLIDGMVDLGALATEFLLLGIDPYPRKPGAVFEPPSTGDPGESPFAALAGLRTGRGKRRG